MKPKEILIRTIWAVAIVATFYLFSVRYVIDKNVFFNLLLFAGIISLMILAFIKRYLNVAYGILTGLFITVAILILYLFLLLFGKL